MDSFGELWSHHPAILPSAPSDGKSRFVPHGVPERHLDRQEAAAAVFVRARSTFTHTDTGGGGERDTLAVGG